MQTAVRLLVVLPLTLPLLGGCDDSASSPPPGDSLVVADAALDQTVAPDGPAGEQLIDLLLAPEGPPPDGPILDTAHDLPLSPDQAPVADAGNACDAAKQAVYAEMKKINSCAVDSDCAFEYGACPFGCYIPRNKSAAAATLQALMTAYKAMTQCPQCVYKCAPPGNLTCVGGACVMN